MMTGAGSAGSATAAAAMSAVAIIGTDLSGPTGLKNLPIARSVARSRKRFSMKKPGRRTVTFGIASRNASSTASRQPTGPVPGPLWAPTLESTTTCSTPASRAIAAARRAAATDQSW